MDRKNKGIVRTLNFSEITKLISDRKQEIRFNKIPKKYIPALDKFFNKDLPEWWNEVKNDIND